MTGNEFLKRLIASYGKYQNPGMFEAVAEWIRDNKHADFAELYRQILTSFETQYNKQPPDVYVLEHTLKPDDSKVYYKGKAIGHVDGGRFIPDLRQLTTENIQAYRDNWEALSYPAAYGAWLVERLQEQPQLEAPRRPALEEPSGEYMDPEDVSKVLADLYRKLKWDGDGESEA